VACLARRKDLHASNVAGCAILGEGLTSLQHYYDYVNADRSGAALAGMLDHLTTNPTRFFREPGYFGLITVQILIE
jgi:chemotaxis methyl-accepting protein methylase